MKRLQTLALEQKEDARHGDATFPIQKYITSLKPDYPVITTHWHEEAEFTLITEGDASYQIDLTSYAVEKDDLIFIPPLLLHSVSRGQSALYQSETYVFHMNFLGGNATDICSTRYLMPLTNEELSVPCLIRPTHPAYVSLRKIFAQISSLFANPVEGYELAIKALLLQVIFLLLQYRTPDGKRSVDTANASEKLKTVLDYIHLHYAEPLTVAGLAAQCYFSEYYFMRFFKKHMNMTVVEYLNNLRLEKAVELFESGALDKLAPGRFASLQAIHKALFEDIYDFAGELRTLNLAKGNFRFAPLMYLEAALGNINKMPQSAFDEIIEKYVEMNIAHPFREGNGRSTRLWLDQMLKAGIGQVVDWSKVDKEDYLLAMERSPIKDVEIKVLLKAALTDDVNSREVFMKGIDHSYYYEGYTTFKTEDLSKE